MKIPAINEDPQKTPAWKQLQRHAKGVEQLRLTDLLDQDGDRFNCFSLQVDELFVDYSRNLLTEETMGLLLELAEQRFLEQWIVALTSGAPVNTTESRPALHTALRNRSGDSIEVMGQDVMPEIKTQLAAFLKFARDVQTGDCVGHGGSCFNTIVNVGIGGSDLGPAMVSEALGDFRAPGIETYFVSGSDGIQLDQVLRQANPENTLFIISSKSFATQETRLNAAAAREWIVEHLTSGAVGAHFAAVSANPAAMAQFGVDPSRSFKIWDWVGGRFSLWSAIGLSIAIATKPGVFMELLDGAYTMDRHFQSAPAAANLPVLLGLIAVWNQNFRGVTDHVILPYNQRLAAFPAYLQQLEMESNGKSIRRDGQAVDYSTAVSIWGSVGANAQHSFAQLLHQGTQRISVDFVAAVRDPGEHTNQNLQTLSNMLAQADALASGQSRQRVQSGLKERSVAAPSSQSLSPHLVHPGNRPSTILLLRELNARNLGMLIALYEHKVFVESVIWGINAFDQWGVEFGKHLAGAYAETLIDDGTNNQITNVARLVQKWREK